MPQSKHTTEKTITTLKTTILTSSSPSPPSSVSPTASAALNIESKLKSAFAQSLTLEGGFGVAPERLPAGDVIEFEGGADEDAGGSGGVGASGERFSVGGPVYCKESRISKLFNNGIILKYYVWRIIQETLV